MQKKKKKPVYAEVNAASTEAGNISKKPCDTGAQM